MSNGKLPRSDLGWQSRGVAAEELRRHNLATLLGELHVGGPRSRSALTTLTGLNRSTVGDLIAELHELGLIEQGPDPAASGPGRPSPIISVRPAGAVTLALEIDVDTLGAAVVGLGGHVFNCVRTAHDGTERTPYQTVEAVADLARPILDEVGAGTQVVGIGVGVAGITRRSDGFVHLAPNLGWRDIALPDLIKAAFGIDTQILVANEADFGAFGEYRRGASRGTRHLIYISGEVGIGAGIVVDGKMLRGFAGYAGEAGHTVVNPGGLPCRCGSIGCWETEAGEVALLRRLGMSAGDIGISSMDAVLTDAAAGDPTTLTALDETGRWLGLGLANLVNVFNPETVVLGGLYGKLFAHLEAAVLAALEDRVLGPPRSTLSVVPSSLGQDARLLGAAEAVYTRFTADPAYGVAAAAAIPAKA